jgi:hypothetical protein
VLYGCISVDDFTENMFQPIYFYWNLSRFQIIPSPFHKNKRNPKVVEAPQEKCTRSPVQNVEKKLRFLLSQMVPDLSIVGAAIRNENQEGFSKIIRKHESFFFFFLFVI